MKVLLLSLTIKTDWNPAMCDKATGKYSVVYVCSEAENGNHAMLSGLILFHCLSIQ